MVRTLRQRIIGALLPTRIKRLVVCAGFYSYVHRGDSQANLERGLLSINSTLALAETTGPLMYAAHLPLGYWNDFNAAEVAYGVLDYDHAVEEAVERIPHHLRYAADEQMGLDLRKIVVLLPVSEQTQVVRLYK